jgi:aminopeptidase
MNPDFAPKLARVLTEYSQPVNPGDYVVIRGEMQAMPAIEALYEAVLRRGGHPTVSLTLPRMQEMLLRLGSDEQLRYGSPEANFLIEHVDVMYSI